MIRLSARFTAWIVKNIKHFIGENMLKPSNYDELDFAKLYCEQKIATSFKPKSASEWDKKAASMNASVHGGVYVSEFLSRMKLEKNDTLLDVGCGPGTIGLAVATQLKSVICADYSDGMLECVKQNIAAKNLNNVEAMKLSFDDEWDRVPVCDIVTASRCLEVADARKTLEKLISKARKSVYLTYNIGRTFMGDEIADILSLEVRPKPDYIYIVNILYQMGYLAKVDFITHGGCRFNGESFEEFLMQVKWSYGVDSLPDSDISGLKKYFDSGKAKRHAKWAFIEIITQKACCK